MLISEIKKKELPRRMAESLTMLLQSLEFPYESITCGFNEDLTEVVVHVTRQGVCYPFNAVYDRIKDFDFDTSNEGLAHNILKHFKHI